MPQPAPEEITLLGGRVRLLHAQSPYKASSDAVWLAATVPARNGDIVLEPGYGTGAAGLSLLARVPKAHLIGLELQADMAATALQNLSLNPSAQVHLVRGNVAHSPFGNFKADHTLANPPYFSPLHGAPKQHPTVRKAHALEDTTLHDWLTFMARHTKDAGTITLINHTRNMPAVAAFAEDVGYTVCFYHLQTKPDTQAKRSIAQLSRHPAFKGGAHTIAAYDDDIREKVLRSGVPLTDVI